MSNRKYNLHKGGFTLTELLIAIAIIGILAAIAFPAMNRLIPDRQVTNEAKMVDSYLQKARLRSASTQKPIRVVINCTGPRCWIELQRAEYTMAAVTSWVAETTNRYYFNKNVTVANLLPPGTTYNYDGSSAAPVNVHYAIFMPDSRVYSDPRPFHIFIYSKGDTSPQIEGWYITLSNDSGRVSIKRETTSAL
jgi:prepilin-type N-terminal cleavage/methylation domain-containing protein